MYGAIKYAQTQYARSSTLADKWKLFLETISLADNRNIGVRKTWQSAITVLEVFDTTAILGRLFKEYISVLDATFRRAIKPLYIETINVSDSIGKALTSLYKDLIEVADAFSSIWTRFKKLVDSVMVDFSGRMSALKTLVDSVLISETGLFSIFKKFISGIAITDVMGFTPFKFIRERINVASVVGKNIVAGWIEALSLQEIFKALPSGMIVKEFIAVTESIVQKTSKTFVGFISMVDSIKLQFNGFLIRWAKRATVSTDWVKSESPTTTWEKKDRRSIED